MNMLELWTAVQAVAAVSTLGLLTYGLKLQRDTAQAARATVEAAERTQRIASRPALLLYSDWQREFEASNSPMTLLVGVKNVGHGTPVVERIQISQWGNPPQLDYRTTESGNREQLEQQFDVEIFQRVVGDRLETLSATLNLESLAEGTRALEVGGKRFIFRLHVRGADYERVVKGFTHVSANVGYRSLAGETFDIAEQFAALRAEPRLSRHG